MHRNTVLVVISLTIVATLLVGINIGRRLNSTMQTLPLNSSPAVLNASPEATSSPLASANNKSYQLQGCGILFEFNPDLFTLSTASNAAELINDATRNKISFGCASEIPRPPISPDRIESITIDTLKTNLYHDASAKDGTPLDAVIFTHPTKKIDVGIFGFGADFTKVIKTIKIIP